ncbi:MAG: hypothetical protein GY928_12270 [Colwellia sp.]|nr:hypothetical protein [Colwellia sp.]
MITKSTYRLIMFTLVVTLLPGVQSVAAKDMGSLYDSAILSQCQPQYKRGILRNLNSAIWPRLTATEKRQLADVQLSFPLRSSGRDPYEFYATTRPPIVTMPVLSLKFFDDLSTAIAWLQLNHYSIETPYEYVSMLKYKDARDLGGRYPPPLEALQIPSAALHDPAVKRLANKIFDSAMAFILLHELGHLYRDHPGYGPDVPRADNRKHEAEADQFAIEILRRTGTNPTGMSVYFIASAHVVANRGDYTSDTEYEAALAIETHPLTENRIRMIATSVRSLASDFARGAPDPVAEVKLINDIANNLTKIVDFLADRELQRFNARIGSTTSLAMLRPRRPGELAAPELSSPPLSTSKLMPFHGAYSGDIGLPDGSVPIKTVLRRQDNHVNGEYYYGAGQGLLSGQVQGKNLFFEWREGPERGHGEFRSEQRDDSFTGSWGFGESSGNGGRWTGTRQHWE